MQTRLSEAIKSTPSGAQADAILRKCVHCGFCLATCPTYELLGDELDSPRGRIYLIKQVLEGAPPSASTQLHLDRCLTCRSCETICPSGVEYGRLLDIGREVIEQQFRRSLSSRLVRAGLRTFMLSPRVLRSSLAVARLLRPLLPPRLRARVPRKSRSRAWPPARHSRTMLVLGGCVQRVFAPEIDAAAAHVLDCLGISLIKARHAGCCGALSHHLTATEQALALARRNIDAWWPHVEAGVEAIVGTSSGCGTMVAEYGHLLRGDPLYAAKAVKVSGLYRDISAVVAAQSSRLRSLLSRHPRDGVPERLAFQSPCSLQHGLRITHVVEALLCDAGFELTAVPDASRCCGSAGSYSLLQRSLSRRLLERKVADLESGAPRAIASANIGCLLHLRGGTRLPVRHWVEILADRLKTTG